MAASTAAPTYQDFWSAVADQVDPDAPETVSQELSDDWRGWITGLFPAAVNKPFGPHHERFWEHVWSIQRGVRPRSYVGIWARKAAKSMSAELAIIALGARMKRRYAVLVCETQEQADKHVATIGSLLESEAVALHYPALGRRAVGKYGTSRGWRRERLHTASGFVIDGLGLDTASRGLRVEAQRPDLIVVDDVDSRHDSKKITRKKIELLTDTILPLGSSDLAVIAIQNLIIAHGIFAQLASRQADFMVDRIVSGPIPAVLGKLEIERTEREDGSPHYRITSGTPSWEGQDLQACEDELNLVGPRAFRREQQHEVHEREGALLKPAEIQHVDAVPEGGFIRVVLGVDPSGGSAEIGIIAAGLHRNGNVYVTHDWTQPGRLGSANWGGRVYTLYNMINADRIAAESNFGGDMVEGTIQAAAGVKVPVLLVHASRGKAIRAEPVAAFYQEGKIVHVGDLPELESEWTQWVPGDKDSPNRLDACVISCTELLLPQGKPPVQRITMANPPGM
jgi:hypothetical protein